MQAPSPQPTTREYIGVDPTPRRPVEPQPSDLHLPTGTIGTILTFAGGVLFPRVWSWFESSQKASQTRRDREIDARLESERNEYKLLEQFVKDNALITTRLIETNERTAEELRGLKDAIVGTNEFMRGEFADLRQRVEAIEAREIENPVKAFNPV